MMKKIFYIFFFFFFSFGVIQSSLANSLKTDKHGKKLKCYDAKSEEHVYKVLYECYLEAPKTVINQKSYPWCHALNLCYATKKVFVNNQNGNICINHKRFTVYCIQKN